MEKKKGTNRKRIIYWENKQKFQIPAGPEQAWPCFLLVGQFSYAHDQPLAVFLMVNRFHIQHSRLDPGFILHSKTNKISIQLVEHFKKSKCQVNAFKREYKQGTWSSSFTTLF